MKPSDHDLRCFCSRQPILAKYGIDAKGQLFVHVKRWKQDRLLCEVVVTSGVVRIHCPNCLRWHRITIRQPERKAEMVPEDLPESIVV